MAYQSQWSKYYGNNQTNIQPQTPPPDLLGTIFGLAKAAPGFVGNLGLGVAKGYAGMAGSATRGLLDLPFQIEKGIRFAGERASGGDLNKLRQQYKQLEETTNADQLSDFFRLSPDISKPMFGKIGTLTANKLNETSKNTPYLGGLDWLFPKQYEKGEGYLSDALNVGLGVTTTAGLGNAIKGTGALANFGKGLTQAGGTPGASALLSNLLGYGAAGAGYGALYSAAEDFDKNKAIDKNKLRDRALMGGALGAVLPLAGKGLSTVGSKLKPKDYSLDSLTNVLNKEASQEVSQTGVSRVGNTNNIGDLNSKLNYFTNRELQDQLALQGFKPNESQKQKMAMDLMKTLKGSGDDVNRARLELNGFLSGNTANSQSSIDDIARMYGKNQGEVDAPRYRTTSFEKPQHWSQDINQPLKNTFDDGISAPKIPKELEGLAQEARKFKNAEEFAEAIIEKYSGGSTDKKFKPGQRWSDIKRMADEYKNHPTVKPEDVIKSEVNRALSERGQSLKGGRWDFDSTSFKPIKEADDYDIYKAFGGKKIPDSGKVKMYRGYSEDGSYSLRTGDFITPSKTMAKTYAGKNGVVKEYEVDIKDLLIDTRGEKFKEAVFAPGGVIPKQEKLKLDYLDFYNEATGNTPKYRAGYLESELGVLTKKGSKTIHDEAADLSRQLQAKTQEVLDLQKNKNIEPNIKQRELGILQNQYNDLKTRADTAMYRSQDLTQKGFASVDLSFPLNAKGMKNIQKEHRRIFGDDNLSIQNFRTFTAEGAEAKGYYQKGFVHLVNGAVDITDTSYHEYAHKALGLFVSDKGKKKIFDEIINSDPKIKNYYDAEEVFAEKFAIYANTRKGVTGKLQLYFDYILNNLKKFVGKEVSASDTEMNRIMRGAYNGKQPINPVDGIKRYSSTASEVSGLQKIGKQVDVEDNGKVLDKLYTEAIDKFNPILKKAYSAGKDVGHEMDLTLATNHYGTDSKARAYVMFDFKKALSGTSTDDVKALSIAQRDIELAGRGIKGSSAQAGQKVLNELKERLGEQKYNQVNQAAQKFRDAQLKVMKETLLDSGVMSQKQFNGIVSKNSYYTSFQRIMDTVDSELGVVKPKAPGSVGSQNVLYGIEGSDRLIKDPLESAVENAFKMTALADRNRVAKQISSLQKFFPEEIVPVKSKDIGGKPHISVMIDGKVQKYLVPKDIAEAAKGLNKESLGTVLKIISQPTKVLRATATGLNPAFLIPNIARDSQAAYLNTGATPLTLGKSFAHFFKKDDLFEDYLRSGGSISRVSGDRNYAEELANTISGKKPQGLAILSPKNLLQQAQKISEFSEQPTRLNMFEKTYNAALKKGLPREQALKEAAYWAQEGTTNFARGGNKMGVVNSLVAFLNARVQGASRTVRTVKSQPGKALPRIALITMTPAVLGYLWNRQYPEYYDERVVPEYERNNNFILMLPEGLPGGTRYLKIPKGDVGKFANGIEELMRFADKGGDTDFIQEIAKAFGEMLPINATPNLSENATKMQKALAPVNEFLPTAIKPLVEVGTNYNFFTGREIVPENKKNLPEFAQSNANTGELYKLLGKQLNVSPAQLENISGGYFSGIEKLLQPVANKAALAIDPTVKSSEPKGAAVNRAPIISRFLGGEKRSEEEQVSIDAAKIASFDFKIRDIKSGVKKGYLTEEQGAKAIADVEAKRGQLMAKAINKYDVPSSSQGSVKDLTEYLFGNSSTPERAPSQVRLRASSSRKGRIGTRKVKLFRAKKVRVSKAKKIRTPKLKKIKAKRLRVRAY